MVMSEFVDVNYFAVLAGAVANMVLGFLWFGPIFGKQWMKLMGVKSNKMSKDQEAKMPMTYSTSFALAIVMSFVMAIVIDFAYANTLILGAKIGFMCWLGFVLATHANSALFENKPKEQVMISTGYYLIA